MEPVCFPTSETWETITNMKQECWLKVGWHDASSFSRVRVITPEIYVTRKITSGYFYACRRDPNSDMHYLILYTEETDGCPSEGSSIPVGCIDNITVEFQQTHAKKAAKKAWKTRAPVKTVEIVRKIIVSE